MYTTQHMQIAFELSSSMLEGLLYLSWNSSPSLFVQELVSLHQEFILVSLVEPSIQEDSFVVDLIPRELPKLANYVPNLWTFCNARYETELIIDCQRPKILGQTESIFRMT